jgi:hypothetical protein
LAAEQRYYSRDRTNLPAKDLADNTDAQSGLDCGDPNRLRREKIDAIERRDDLTANQQLLQIVAIAELVIAQDAEPKIRGGSFLFVQFHEGLRNEHADVLSTTRATPPERRKSEIPKAQFPGILEPGVWNLGFR